MSEKFYLYVCRENTLLLNYNQFLEFKIEKIIINFITNVVWKKK